jgi:hypothetical protein
MVNEISEDARVFLNSADGTGQFQPFIQPTFPTDSGSSPNEPSDFNRDGHIDLCVANGVGGTISILLGMGDGTFAPQQLIPVGFQPRGIAVLDVDGDGDTDIVNTNYGSSAASSQMSLLLNDGTGTFGAPAFFEAGGDGERALAAGDMNEDGIADLVIGDRRDGDFFIHLGNGDGTFTPFSSGDIGGKVWMLGLGDLNGDGHEDVHAVNVEEADGAILFGDGTGQLGLPQTYDVFTTPLATDVGDMDGDGDLDWITSSYDGEWELFRNNGSGSFTSYQIIPATDAASCALMMDIDNDLDLDLVLVDELEDELIVVRNACHPDDQVVWYEDSDGDGFGDNASTEVACFQPSGFVADGTDCDDRNPNIWGTPGEVPVLVLEPDGQTVSWSPPIDQGGSTLVYDTLRTSDPADFDLGAVCVESDDGTDTMAVDSDPVPAGVTYYYLVRAENACPAGEGSLGNDSDGASRSGRTCP